MTHALRPLVLACLCLLVGLLPALRFAPPPLPLLVAVPCLLVASHALRKRGAPYRAPVAADTLLWLAFVAAGAGLGSGAARAAAADCRFAVRDGEEVEVRGVLGASVLRPVTGDGPPLVPLEHARISWSGGHCAGTLRVRLTETPGVAVAGGELRLAGRWVRYAPPVVRSAWPVPPLRAGFVAVDTVRAMLPPDARSHPLLYARGRVEVSLHRLFPRHFAVADALLLGRREWMDPDVRERFARAGLVHLLAISGTHVGLLAAALLLAGAALRIPRRRVAAGTLGLVALYLGVIGAPASAVRSGIMLALALLAVLLQRPAAALPIMAAAAMALLAWDPLAVLDPGFQLSFAGVAALMAAGRLRARWPRALRRPALRYLADGLAVSAAAFALTAPITAHHFGTVAPVAILANLPAIPLSGLALIGIAAAWAVEGLVPALASLVADGAGVALTLLDAVAGLAARVPAGHLDVARPDWLVWGAAVLAAAVAARAARRLRAGARAGVAVGCAGALLVAWPALARSPDGALEIHFLDVGQGDAIALRTPARRWVLIDAGPRVRDHDAGERRVLPFLRAHRATHLEALILTHPDADHIGGAPAVLRGIPVRRVVEPGLATGKDLYLEVLALAESLDVQWLAARRGRALEVDGVRIEMLWPRTVAGEPEANEISTVTRIRYGAFTALLTGDVSTPVEEWLVEHDGDGLRAQVLKAGHHGSRTSTSERLLRAVRPELVVISAGRRNRYGHPAPEVIGRLRAHGIRIARTDLEGTLSLRVDARTGNRWSRVEP